MRSATQTTDSGPAPPALAIAGSLAAVLLISAGVARGWRSGYAPVGWLWFLVALVPTLGLTQAGVQGMASRALRRGDLAGARVLARHAEPARAQPRGHAGRLARAPEPRAGPRAARALRRRRSRLHAGAGRRAGDGAARPRSVPRDPLLPLGRSLQELGQNERAREALRRAVALVPGYRDGPARLAALEAQRAQGPRPGAPR